MRMKGFIAIAVALSVPQMVNAQNFKVMNLPREQAKVYEAEAEKAYKGISKYFFGKSHPDLADTVEIYVKVKRSGGAGGATSFSFPGNGQVTGWKMQLEGSTHRVMLDSVLPHEVCHIVMAAKFGKRFPRWIDEGISALWETPKEREFAYNNVIRRGLFGQVRLYRFRDLLVMKEYPRDGKKIGALYGQGAAIVQYLHAKYGKGKLMEYMGGNSPVTDIKRVFGVTPEQIDRDWKEYFVNRYMRKETGDRKSTFASSATKKDTRPWIIVFSSRSCKPCDKWKRDHEAGRLGNKYRWFVVYEEDKANWNKWTAYYKRVNGKSLPSGTPTFWVYGTKRPVVQGYEAPGGLLGAIGKLFVGIIKLFIGDAGKPIVRDVPDRQGSDYSGPPVTFRENVSDLVEKVKKVKSDVDAIKDGSAFQKVKALAQIKGDIKDAKESAKNAKDSAVSSLAKATEAISLIKQLKEASPKEKAKLITEVLAKVSPKFAENKEKIEKLLSIADTVKGHAKELREAETKRDKLAVLVNAYNEKEGDEPPFGMPFWLWTVISVVLTGSIVHGSNRSSAKSVARDAVKDFIVSRVLNRGGSQEDADKAVKEEVKS